MFYVADLRQQPPVAPQRMEKLPDAVPRQPVSLHLIQGDCTRARLEHRAPQVWAA
jgi:hypothetical protein